MNEIANSWWMYLLGAVICLYVLGGAIFFILRSYKRAKEIGMDTKLLKKTIIDSALFSLLPSISILIGLFALSGILGVPFPWIRLTVIGALHYEATAASVPYGEVVLASLTAKQFVTIAFVMTLGIISGPLFCFFGFKFYDKKVLSKLKKKESTTEVVKEENIETKEEVEEEIKEDSKPKKSFGPILFNAAFIAMISSFLAEYFALLKNTGKENVSPVDSWIPTVVVFVSFGSMALLTFISKKFKQKWLNSFALGFSMLIGMGTAVLLQSLFGGM